MRRALIIVIAGVLGVTAAASAADVTVVSDSTWKVTSPAPAAGWNTDVVFDESAWVNAVDNPTNHNMWMTSLQSASGPNQVWARKVFHLGAPVASAVGHFGFDDNGQLYLNGHLLIDDTGGGATVFDNFAIDPSFFIVGDNLIAMHGIDTIAPFNSLNANLPITLVPEPGYASLAGLGAIWLLARSRKAAIARNTT
jgi:hypothetical protein